MPVIITLRQYCVDITLKKQWSKFEPMKLQKVFSYCNRFSSFLSYQYRLSYAFFTSPFPLIFLHNFFNIFFTNIDLLNHKVYNYKLHFCIIFRAYFLHHFTNIFYALSLPHFSWYFSLISSRYLKNIALLNHKVTSHKLHSRLISWAYLLHHFTHINHALFFSPFPLFLHSFYNIFFINIPLIVTFYFYFSSIFSLTFYTYQLCSFLFAIVLLRDFIIVRQPPLLWTHGQLNDARGYLFMLYVLKDSITYHTVKK